MIAADISLHFSDFLPFLATIILAVAVILLVVAAYGDVKHRRIPNILTAIIAALGICRLIVLADPIVALYTIGVASLALFITFLLFISRVIGGGDVKLLTATVLLIGYHAVFPFLAIMSICGAVLSITILLCLRTTETKSTPSVPYEVAIAAGAILTLFLQFPLIG